MELHIARCDAPGCQSEAPVRAPGVLPDGWIRAEQCGLDAAIPSLMCSWACVAAYAEQRVEEAADGR